MKRKSELGSLLDEMFCEDLKKRINAIKMMEQIATALGPQRTRDELVPFLNQFFEDQSQVMLTVVQQIGKLRSFLGGIENQKLLLQPLISFCCTDQMEIAMQATKIMVSILSKATSEYVDCIKKLVKTDMNVAKQSAALLIVSGIQKLPHLTTTFIQIYKTMAYSEKASVRIIASKHLHALFQKIENKEQIVGIIQILYSCTEDLPKLLTIQTLISLYPTNSNFVMNKFKMLTCSSKWRFNMKMCEYADKLAETFTKSHFKIVIEPAFLAMMNSTDIELKSSSCAVLSAVAKNMTPEENSAKLLPILENLSCQKSPLSVKKHFSRNIVCLFPYFTADKIKQKLLPIIISLLKENNLEISTGIIENFKGLAKELKSNDKVEQIILKPLSNQLLNENWRLRSNILITLGKIAITDNLALPAMIDLFINGCLDRVQAIRNISTGIIIDMIKKNSEQWCKSELMPKLLKIRDSKNYLIRQKILSIIESTADQVGNIILEQYKKILILMINDKTPNIRMIALKISFSKPKLIDKAIQSQLSKMKDDTDTEIRHIAKAIKA